MISLFDHRHQTLRQPVRKSTAARKVNGDEEYSTRSKERGQHTLPIAFILSLSIFVGSSPSLSLQMVSQYSLPQKDDSPLRHCPPQTVLKLPSFPCFHVDRFSVHAGIVCDTEIESSTIIRCLSMPVCTEGFNHGCSHQGFCHPRTDTIDSDSIPFVDRFSH